MFITGTINATRWRSLSAMVTPMCDTFWHSTMKGGNVSDTAGVGACKVSACKYNKKFECGAREITINYHDLEPDCMTFETERISKVNSQTLFSNRISLSSRRTSKQYSGWFYAVFYAVFCFSKNSSVHHLGLSMKHP